MCLKISRTPIVALVIGLYLELSIRNGICDDSQSITNSQLGPKGSQPMTHRHVHNWKGWEDWLSYTPAERQFDHNHQQYIPLSPKEHDKVKSQQRTGNDKNAGNGKSSHVRSSNKTPTNKTVSDRTGEEASTTLLGGLLALAIFPVNSVPITANSNIHCPVPTTDDEFGSHKVLDLSEIKGHKVRLQFFYPREEASKKLLDSRELALLEQDAMNKTSTNLTDTVESGTITTIDKDDLELFKQDIFCQWTFRAGNESEFLSLTFEKLSAPYSEDCTQAFVALQKENGYESRWCGNRRQANARPMSLLAKSTAVITVFRSGTAPLLPATGFKVAVKNKERGYDYIRIHK